MRAKTKREIKRAVGFLAGLFLSVTFAQADNKVYTTDVNKLPVISQQFLEVHFKAIKVAHISIEKNWAGVGEYEVILTDGTEIEFDKTGEWKEVTRTNLPVPPGLVATAVEDYVKANFPSMYMEGVEKKKRKYEVKLNTGLELEFDLKGRFKRIDD